MSRILLTMIVVSLMIVGCTVERPKPPLDVSRLNMDLELGIALGKAQEIYQQAVTDGLDLTNGPCLANELHGNPDYPLTMWVLDIAHYPREEVDNQPENQCEAYREGRAENFVEFSPEGELIRIYSPLIEKED